MKQLRILESITPSTIGGAEICVAATCRTLQELGAHVELFCPAGRAFLELASARGISTTSWKTHGKVDPLTIIKLRRLIRSHKIDIIHTHLSTASLLGAYAAGMSGIPSVAHVHGLNSTTFFRHSTLVVAVSEAVKEHLQTQGLDEHRIRVVHNGLDLDKFQPMSTTEAKRQMGYDTDRPLLGIFGRLSKEKGQSIALHAMCSILREYQNARLVLAGKGSELPNLKEVADSLQITDAVHFAGFTSDIRTLMSACDIVIVPSLKEGFGMAVLEAMALHKPVVASSVGGLKEIVVDGDTGFIVSANDPDSLASSVKNLIGNTDMAQQMGRRGRERVENHFELRNQTRKLMAVIEEALTIQA